MGSPRFASLEMEILADILALISILLAESLYLGVPSNLLSFETYKRVLFWKFSRYTWSRSPVYMGSPRFASLEMEIVANIFLLGYLLKNLGIEFFGY